MKIRKSIVGIILSLVIIGFGLYFISQAFDKKNHYYNSENYSRLNINAYVGGDAYNYIINSGYFSGYCSLGGSLFVSGTILLCGSVFLSKKEQEQNNKKQTIIEEPKENNEVKEESNDEKL